MSKDTSNAKLEVIPAAKMAVAPKLIDGTDKVTAKKLDKLFTDANTGMRRIVALGLFAIEVKETKLKHSQFGPWLAANCPKLATVDSVTGNAKPSRALSGYMDLTKNVLESVGFDTIEKYLATVAKFANDANLGGGKFLLIAEKKVPEDLRDVHDKICSLVDGKSQRSLFMEFKQAEEDVDGSLKKKRGRLKGQGGASAEQRAAAAEREEQARLEQLTESITESNTFELEIADANGLGKMDSRLLAEFITARETSVAFARRVLESRKGAKA